MTEEGKVKEWLHYTWLPKHMPGHWRVSPRGGPFGKIGCPDDIICWHGIFIAIEVKAPGGKPTPPQLAQLRMIIKAGGIGAVLIGRDEVKMQLILKAVNDKLNVLQHRIV